MQGVDIRTICILIGHPIILNMMTKKGIENMPFRVFDYGDGDYLNSVSDNMAVDSDGNLMFRLGDSLAMDLDTGDVHLVSLWSDDDQNN